MAFSFQEYRIIDEIGRGAFGTVYRARQNSLNRIVAVKSLSPQRTQNRHDIIRFRQEAQAMASLTHDAIVTVYDYAYHHGSYYIVMEYVDGITLEHLFAQSAPIPLMFYVLERIAHGLQCAHEKGIVHRDIKPNNILLGSQGQIKLADFGLAAWNRESGNHSSMAGATVGTLCYMAPEAMVSPDQVDWRVDVYALGCILYRVFTGRLPYDGSGLGDISYKVLNEEPRPIENDHGYGHLAELTICCLAKDREQRPSTEQLNDALVSAVSIERHSLAKQLAQSIKGVAIRSDDGCAYVKKGIREKRNTIVRRGRWAAIILAVILAAVTAIIGIRQIRCMNNSELPELSAIERASSFRTFSLQAPPEDADSIIQVRNGPLPITSVSQAEDIGVIIIRGLQPLDTIVINSKVSRISGRESGVGIPASAGMCTVEIKGNDNRYMKKQFTIKPPETTEWNLKGDDQ